MGKKLCSKNSEERLKAIDKKFVCKKCGLKAEKEKKLCKPFRS
jgi:hypothetical protein